MQDSVFFEALREIAHTPKRRGAIFQTEADDRGLALVDVKSGTLKVYILIDPDSEQILDTKFFTYSGPLITALADVFCEELVNKNINKIQNISPETLFGKYGITAESEEFKTISGLLTLIVDAYPEKRSVAFAARAAMGSEKLRAITVEGRIEADNEWNKLSESEKLEKVEQCLNEHVRMMLEGDGGGLDVLGIKNPDIVMIRYNGACVACGAASGGTLYFIEDKLQQYVYYGLTVETVFPDLPEMPYSQMDPPI